MVCFNNSDMWCVAPRSAFASFWAHSWPPMTIIVMYEAANVSESQLRAEKEKANKREINAKEPHEHRACVARTRRG